MSSHKQLENLRWFLSIKMDKRQNTLVKKYTDFIVAEETVFESSSCTRNHFYTHPPLKSG
jgi:hypothetical protein